MLTFLDLYNECAGQPWSMFDNDAMSNEDFESAMRISINKALSYLWNYQDWAFRYATKTFRTKPNVTEYSMPNGNLTRTTTNGVERYGVQYNGEYLPYNPTYDTTSDEKGSPEYFYIVGDKLFIYPTPDASYQVDLTYLKLPCVLSANLDQQMELKEDDDYVNISEKYEVLFKNCLISLSMMYAIAEETDENYSAYKKQYEDALMVLLKYCRNGSIDRNIVW